MPSSRRGARAAHQYLQTLFDAGTVAGLTDGALLDRFEAGHGESAELAFAALIERHGPMVYRVCRKVLGDAHDAEDAFQATFLILVRSAGSIRRRAALGPYLHGVALRVAACAGSAVARRRRHELRYAERAQTTTITRSVDEIGPALHEELGRLPTRYQSVAVLCILEGKTYAEAARLIDCPIGTVMSRLAEARRRLQGRLARRGLAPSAALVTAALAGEAEASTQAVPQALVEMLMRSAIPFASNPTKAAAVPSAVALLTREVLKTMFLTKVKVLAAVVGLGLAALGAGVLAQPPGRSRPIDPNPDRRVTSGPEVLTPPRIEVAVNANQVPETQQDYGDLIAPMPSYPFKIDPEEIYEYPELVVSSRNLRLDSGPVALVPVSCARGITGVLLIGNGTFRYGTKIGTEFAGHFHAALLRFNPEEQAALVRFDKAHKVTDRGLHEMSRALLQVVLRHCYQSTKNGGRTIEVLIPPKGSFAAVLYSKEHGDLLISDDEMTAVVHNFTENKTLYEKKP